VNTIANAAPTCVRLRCATGVDPGCGGESRAIAPTRGIRAMTSEATRDRVAYKPISTDRSQAEGIAGFASRGHGATNGDAWLQARAATRVYLP
jgi:hypothetical protein